MLILYPRLKNGNVLWSCDNCNKTAEITSSDTQAVAIYCMCDNSMHPLCNDKWYNSNLYFKKTLLYRLDTK